MFYQYPITRPLSGPDDYDEVVALATLQGLINRDGPRLYITNVEYRRPEYWLERLSQRGRWLHGVERRTITGLQAVFNLARPILRGAVIWDPEVPATLNVATTIAGVEDAVVLSPTMAERVQPRWRLPIIQDLRGRFTGKETGSRKNDAYRWAIREYLDTGRCSSRMLCLYTDSFFDRPAGQIAYLILRDWAVRNRAFTYDLSPWGDETPADDRDQPLGTDLATYKLMLEATLRQSAGRHMTEVGGFFSFHKYANMPGNPSNHDPVPTEWETVHLISPYNCYQNTATEFSYNQSFHSHAPQKPLSQQRPARRELENKAYIAVLMADYDSTFPLYHFLPDFWDDPVRGELPLNWGVNPNLTDAYPDVIAYLYQTATPRDFFVADASAAGYMNPNRIQPRYLPLFVRHNQYYYRKTGMSISGMVLDWDQPTPAVKDAFVRFSPDGYATIVSDMHGGGGKPPRPHVWKWMPIVNLLGADPNSAEAAASAFYDGIRRRKRDEPGFYNFRCVWVSPSQVKAAVELLARQHPEEPFEVVDLYTFFDLFRRHYNQVHAGKEIWLDVPASVASLHAGRFRTTAVIQNISIRPLQVDVSVAGVLHGTVEPARSLLRPDEELTVVVSGESQGKPLSVTARTRRDYRTADARIVAIPPEELLGDRLPASDLMTLHADLDIDRQSHLTGSRGETEESMPVWQVTSDADPAGYLTFGPYGVLPSGRYVAVFRMRRIGDGLGDVVVVDVSSAGRPIGGAQRTVTVDELPLNRWRSVVMAFTNPDALASYEARVNWVGSASLQYDRTLIYRVR